MGERPLVRYCESLGQVRVKNIPKAKAGEMAIEMTLHVDEDEKLSVTAIESKHKKPLLVEFEFNETYESKGVQLIIDAIKYKAQDNEVQKKINIFKNRIKDVRIKYQRDYAIREEMNLFMSKLNRLKYDISIEIIDQLLNDLENRTKKLKLKKSQEQKLD